MKFRMLNVEETDLYREWARQNYSPFDDIKGVWHPVIQLECSRINAEESHAINPHADNPVGRVRSAHSETPFEVE